MKLVCGECCKRSVLCDCPASVRRLVRIVPLVEAVKR